MKTIMSTATATQSGKSTRKDTRLVDSLNLVLADSYALMGLSHLAHWNIEGSDFFQLHKAFEEQYENLFEAVDEDRGAHGPFDEQAHAHSFQTSLSKHRRLAGSL